MFCPSCSSINFSWPDDLGEETCFDEKGKYVFHTFSSMKDLVTSFRDGCVVCAQIASVFVKNTLAKKSSPVHLLWDIDDKDKIPPRFRAMLDEGIARNKIHWESFRIYSVDGELADILRDSSELCDTSTGSKASFCLIRLWLNRCLTTHKECTLRTSSLRSLPTRILSVGTSIEPEVPRLVSGDGRFGPYVAVSHVWGQEQIITTTKSTLPDRSDGIAFTLLSKTFQDAIFVARELNIRYLWIDSLCIVQDSIEDWELESSKMGDYYQNAILTIAATRSKDGKGGCFSDSNSWLFKPCPIGSSWTRSSCGGFDFIQPDTSVVTYASSSSSSQNPLDYRAWCVQERLLSPRVLSYSHEGMNFMCLSSYASERSPQGGSLAERMDIEDIRLLRNVFSRLGTLANGNGTETNTPDDSDGMKIKALRERDWYMDWYRLITTYSSCQLSHQTDILPAIAGMASVFQKTSNDTYVSGLWKNDLKRGLLWFAHHRNTTSRPPIQQYVGPSWSWTSLIAPRGIEYECTSVSSPTIESSSCCSIIHAKSQVIGRNPFGKVECGVLEVSGFLREIVRPPNTDSVWSVWLKYCPEFPNLRMGFRMDVESETPVGTRVLLFPLSVFQSGLRKEALDDELGENFQDWDDFEKSVGDKDGANCLLLIQVSDTDEVYRRVGLVQTEALYCFRGCKRKQFRII